MLDNRRWHLALLAGTAAVLAVPASAQTAAQTSQEANQPQSTSDNPNNGEITVTARRTNEKLQRVPAAISAFNEKALERVQAVDPTGLQGAVPNLNIVQGRGSSNAMNIYIRGVGQPDALQTFDPAVGVYVDDVYYSRIRGTQLDLLDIDRIEVLRGPQGTLYGKNTIGGALKIITKKPGNTFHFNAELAAGNYHALTFKAGISGPIANGVAGSLSFLRSSHDGYVRDKESDRRYNDKDTTAMRAALAFTPTDRLRIDLTGDYSADHDKLNVGQPLNDLTTLFGTVLPVPDQASNHYDFTARISPNLPNKTRLKHRGLSGTVSYDLSDALTFKSISAQRWLDTLDYIDIDASTWNIGDVLVDVSQKQLSQEFQLALTGQRLSGVAGLYYLDEDIGSHQESFGSDYLRFSPFIPPVGFLRTIDDQLNTKSYAAYANGSFSVTDTVRLSAGLRYTHEHKDYDRSTTRFLAGNVLDVYPFRAKDSWNDWSPMASVDWQVAPQVMLYAKASHGFKSGGFNGRANSPAESTEYKPETMWSYEAGVKSRIGGRATVNFDIFQNDYKDFQARVGSFELDPVFNRFPTLSVLNAGKLRGRGAELEASWTPVANLLLDTQIGYLDSKYRKFDDSRFPGGSRAFQTPAFSPKWTMRFGGQYSADLGSTGWLTFGGQSRYKSRTALAVDNTYIVYPTPSSGGVGTTNEVTGLFQKGYWVEDARVVWEDPSRRFSVGVYGNNLTDRVYKTDAQEFSSVGSIRTVYYGAPRTVTLRLIAHY